MMDLQYINEQFEYEMYRDVPSTGGEVISMMTFQLLREAVEALTERLNTEVETERLSRRLLEKRISDLEAWAESVDKNIETILEEK
jgi:hypothetical protein